MGLDCPGVCRSFVYWAQAFRKREEEEHLRIAHAASEVYPFARTGGLADVLCSLPAALEKSGHQVSLIIPYYRSLENLAGVDWLPPVETSLGEEFGIGRILHPDTGCPVYMISKDLYFDRSGLYGPREGGDYPDNASRFSFFSRAVAAAVEQFRFKPDVLHCHDWHTGLAPLYLQDSGPATVFTIHNLAFQGNFPSEQFVLTGLPESLLTPDGLEFWGNFSFMKAGILFSDRLTTVSPTYAREILTSENGEGMNDILEIASDRLTGILNGIDFSLWDPSTDSVLAMNFGEGSSSGKKLCRKSLCAELGLIEPDTAPLAGIVSRLSYQKGIDLLFPIAEKLVESGISLVILGTGDRDQETALLELGDRFPGRISVTIGFDDSLARKIFAGSDIYLMPSRFEPCGLAQMMAMRYGSVPVVRRTGGLADTVFPASEDGNGFLFDGETPGSLLKSITEAAGLFRDRRRWAWIRRRCMRCNNSWSDRVSEYEQVYIQAMENRRER